jgi:hypothetical protein
MCCYRRNCDQKNVYLRNGSTSSARGAELFFSHESKWDQTSMQNIWTLTAGRISTPSEKKKPA